MYHAKLAAIAAALLIAVGAALTGGSSAHAQFPPPSTIFGSISDSEGEIDEGLEVRAYIGDTVCSDERPDSIPVTVHTGDGDARVAVYVVDVVSREQKAGCGRTGAEVRIQIGDRFADETASWAPGPIRLDLTFGDATPAPIPTFTPTATATATPTPDPRFTATPTATIATEATTGPGGQGGNGDPDDTGTPGGSDDDGTPNATEDGDGATPDATSSSSALTGDDGDGGFPTWAFVLIAIGVLAVAGGGIGYVMSRTQEDSDTAPEA